MKRLRKSGFTLVEFIVYVAVFTIAAGGLTLIVTDVLRIQGREAASTEVSQQLTFVLNTVHRLINDSRAVEAVYQTGNEGVSCSDAVDYCTMKLRLEGDSLDPTWVVASAEGVNIIQGDESEGDDSADNATDRRITTDKVVVDYMRFTKYEIEDGHPSARISLALNYNSTNPQFAVTRSVQSAIGRVTAAVFDDHLLPNAANTYDVGQTSSEWRNGAFSGNVTIAGALDLTSIASGFLLPRVTTVQRDAISSPGAGSLVYNSTTGKYNFFNTVWNALNLWTASSTAAYYNDGNVGIGTDNPTYTLDVSGSGRFTSPVPVDAPVLDNDAATKAYVDASGGSGYTECYAYAIQANQSCPSPFTTLWSTSGTSCVTTGPNGGNATVYGPGYAFRFFRYTNSNSFYESFYQWAESASIPPNKVLCSNNGVLQPSSVNVCCK